MGKKQINFIVLLSFKKAIKLFLILDFCQLTDRNTMASGMTIKYAEWYAKIP